MTPVPPPPLAWEASGYEVKNGWIVDEHGRAIILHGLNLSGGTKMPFYRPFLKPTPTMPDEHQSQPNNNSPLTATSSSLKEDSHHTNPVGGPSSSPSSATSSSATGTPSHAGEVPGVIYSYKDNHFFDHRQVSFVNRPFPLSEADTHFARLALWGSQCLRLLVPWEALEHAGPGEYDEEYIQYLVELLTIAAKYRLKCFIDPHVDCWSRFTGGSGMPGWTLELAGLDMTKFRDTCAAVVHNTASESDKEDYPHMMWATNSIKMAAATMYTLFFAGQVFAPKALVPLDTITLRFLREIHAAIEAEHEYLQGHGPRPASPVQHLIPVPALIDGAFLERGRVNIQHYLQAHFIECFAHLAKRIHDLDDSLQLIESGTVMGFDTMNEPSPGYLNHPDLNKLLELADLKVGICPTPFQGMLLAAGHTVVCEDWTTGQLGPLKRGSVKVNANKTCLWKRPVWSDSPSSLTSPSSFSHLSPPALPFRPRTPLLSKNKPQLQHPLLNADQNLPTKDWPAPSSYSQDCLWAQHGVWDPALKVLVQPNYFERIPRYATRLGFGEGGTASTTGTMVHRATVPFQYRPGEVVEWKADFWLPFVNTMTLRIRQQDRRYLMFVEPPINECPPNFRLHKELMHNMWNAATDWTKIGQKLKGIVGVKKAGKKKKDNDRSGRTEGKDGSVSECATHTHTVHEMQRLEPVSKLRTKTNRDQPSLEPLAFLRQQLDQTKTLGEGDIRNNIDQPDLPLPKQWGWCSSSEQHAVFDVRGDVSENIVAAPHFYDGYSNITRDFVPFTLDYIGYKDGIYSNVLAALHFGWRNVEKIWRQQVGFIRRDIHMSMGNHVGVLMGETGLPMDMHDRASFRHGYGDPKQDFAMGMLLRSMDESRLSYTLWNYCSDNSNKWGDRWNGEDFSVWCEPDHTYMTAKVEEASLNKGREKSVIAAAASPARKLTLTEVASELPLESTGCKEGPIWWCCVPRGIVWIKQKRALSSDINDQLPTSPSSSSATITASTPASGSDLSIVSSSNELIQSKQHSSDASPALSPPLSSSKTNIVKTHEWQDVLPRSVQRERQRDEYQGLRCAENFVRAYPLATRGEPLIFRFEAGRTVKKHNLLDPSGLYAAAAVAISAPLLDIRTIQQEKQKQCWETRFSLIVKLTCKEIAELEARERANKRKNNVAKGSNKETSNTCSSSSGAGTNLHSTDVFLPRFHFPLDSPAGLLHFEPSVATADSDLGNALKAGKEGKKQKKESKPSMGRWHQLEVCGTDGWWAMDTERQVLRYWPAEQPQGHGAGEARLDGRTSSMYTSGVGEPISLNPMQQVADAKDPTLSDMERRLVSLQALGWDEQQTPGVTCTKEQEWIQQWFKSWRQQQQKKKKNHAASGGSKAGNHSTGNGTGNKGKEAMVVASPCCECGQAQVMHLHGLTVAIKIWQGPAPLSAQRLKEE